MNMLCQDQYRLRFQHLFKKVELDFHVAWNNYKPFVPSWEAKMDVKVVIARRRRRLVIFMFTERLVCDWMKHLEKIWTIYVRGLVGKWRLRQCKRCFSSLLMYMYVACSYWSSNLHWRRHYIWYRMGETDTHPSRR